MSDNNKTRTLHEIFECQLPNNLEPLEIDPNDEYECTCSEDPFVKPIMPMSPMKRVAEIDLIMARFIKEIKKARLNALLTQAQVAKALGVSCQQYQKYESGVNRISIERLILFFQFVNIDVGDFLNKCLFIARDV